MKSFFSRFIRQSHGQDLIEYAMLAGIVTASTVLAIEQVSTKVVNVYGGSVTQIVASGGGGAGPAVGGGSGGSGGTGGGGNGGGNGTGGNGGGNSTGGNGGGNGRGNTP